MIKHVIFPSRSPYIRHILSTCEKMDKEYCLTGVNVKLIIGIVQEYLWEDEVLGGT